MDNVEEAAKVSESLYSNTSLLTYQNGFKDGAKWKMNVLLDNAIDAVVSDMGISKQLRFNTRKFLEAWRNYDVGTKLKIIIVKED